MSVEVTGIAWYRKEDYDRLMAMFTDREKLPATYEDWLAQAQTVMVTLTGRGLLLEKSYIDPETFPQWCAEKGLEMVASARTHYAAELAQKKFEEKKTRKLSI